MKQLPPGFVIDSAPTASVEQSSLPSGFILDPQVDDADGGNDAGFLTNVGRGFIDALKSRGLGIAQLGADVLPDSLVSPASEQLLQDEAALLEAKRKQGISGIGGFIGQVAGDPLTYVPVPGGGGLSAIAKRGAGLGALSGATAPVTDDDSRLTNAALGATLGGAASGTVGALTSLPSATKKAGAKALGIDSKAVKDFASLGIDPNIAAVGGESAKIIQNTLSDLPGSSGVVRKAANKTLDQMSQRVTKEAAKLGDAKTAYTAGRAIQEGADSFITRFTKKSSALYDEFDALMPKDKGISVNNTKEFLRENLSRFNDLPNLKIVLDEPIVARAFKDIGVDKVAFDPVFGRKVLPNLKKYGSIKALRTVIGDKLKGANLDGDSRSTLKRMYGALSKDMEGAARDQGDKAYNAFKRANSYFAAGSQRIDDAIKKVVDSGSPEKVFNLAIQGAKSDVQQLARLKRSLKPEEFGQLQSAVIRRMGKATAGAQDATGDAFSASRYLTNWNNLSPESKVVLFGGKNKGLTKSMDKLARVASSLKDVQSLANTSGTARELATVGVVAGLLTKPIKTIGGLTAGYGSAKLMASPKFVNWLADGLKMKTESQVSQHLAKLSVIAANNPDIRGEINTYLQSIGGGQE